MHTISIKLHFVQYSFLQTKKARNGAPKTLRIFMDKYVKVIHIGGDGL